MTPTPPTSAPATPDEATKALAAIDGEIKTIIIAANKMEVSTLEQSEHATTFLGELKTEKDQLEKMRKELTGGLNESLQKINKLFKSRSEPLGKAEIIVKRKFAEYIDAEAKKAAEIAAKAAEKQAKKEAAAQKKIDDANDEAAKKKAEAALEKTQNAAPEIEAAPTSVRTAAGLASARKIWKFDIEDEQKIPREFLVPDSKKINAAIRDGNREIAGLKIYQDTIISVR